MAKKAKKNSGINAMGSSDLNFSREPMAYVYFLFILTYVIFYVPSLPRAYLPSRRERRARCQRSSDRLSECLKHTSKASHIKPTRTLITSNSNKLPLVGIKLLSTMTIPDSKDTDQTTASLARKRRIELRNLQRVSSGSDDSSEDGSRSSKRLREADDEVLLDPITSKPKPSITGIKRQSRYDPGVPMTREELTAWRKEARRVRNRESAAASRKRNRERITELESDLDALRSKYSAALQRIVELEAAAAVNDSFTPAALRQDIENIVSPGASAPSSPKYTSAAPVSPPLSPTQSFSLSDSKHHDEVNKKVQHIMDMISRPLA